jgi:hypothetical protein
LTSSPEKGGNTFTFECAFSHEYGIFLYSPFQHFPLFILYRRKILRSYLSNLILVFILLILSGCAASTVSNIEKKGGTALSAQEIFDMSSENTLRLISSDFDAYIFFSRDGSLSARSIFNNNVDYGKWDIKKDGNICLKFNLWYFGDTNCYSTYKDPEKDQYLFFTSNGALAYSATASTGNPQRLKIKTKKDKKDTYVRQSMSQQQSVQQPVSTPATNTPAAAPVTTNSGSVATKEEVKHTVKSMAQNCPDCNFEDADLRQAHLVGANLKGANLKGADLSRANLRRANLEGANLSGATLLSTNLPGANLKDVDLSGADLTGSNLIRADLTGADLNGCILENTLQEGVKGL